MGLKDAPRLRWSPTAILEYSSRLRAEIVSERRNPFNWDADSVSPDRAAPRASWDFSKTSLYPTEKAGPPLSSSQFARASFLGAIQAKLVVGEVNDPLEHEADRIADRVTRMPDGELSVAPTPMKLS